MFRQLLQFLPNLFCNLRAVLPASERAPALAATAYLFGGRAARLDAYFHEPDVCGQWGPRWVGEERWEACLPLREVPRGCRQRCREVDRGSDKGLVSEVD